MIHLGFDLSPYAPVGQDVERLKNRLLVALGICCFLSCAGLSVTYGYVMVYIQDTWTADMAPTFQEVAQWPLAFYNLIPLFLFIRVVRNYALHRDNSRSDYLMRRLPDRWEYHRRCWGFPLLGLVLTQLCQWANALVFFAFYKLATPAHLTPAHSWRSLLEVLL